MLPRARQLASSSSSSRLIDIGCNLTDPMFRGVYRGKRYHADDLGAVLRRAGGAGVEKVVVTAGSLEDAKAAIAMVRRALLSRGSCGSRGPSLSLSLSPSLPLSLSISRSLYLSISFTLSLSLPPSLPLSLPLS